MLGMIGFEDLRVDCIIGDLPEERKNPQTLSIDLQVSLDFSDVSTSDDLADTIDYVLLAEICKKSAQEGKFRMLEALAPHILDKIFMDTRIQTAKICIKKSADFMNARWAKVEMERCRNEC